MVSRKSNPTIIAEHDIVSKLPRLAVKATQEDKSSISLTALLKVKRLMEVGVLFETPSKIPEISKERFKYIPQCIRRLIRSSYGLMTVLHQKLNSNKNDAFYLLIQEIAETIIEEDQAVSSKPKSSKRVKR